jgi:hypothetical protein
LAATQKAVNHDAAAITAEHAIELLTIEGARAVGMACLSAEEERALYVEATERSAAILARAAIPVSRTWRRLGR